MKQIILILALSLIVFSCAKPWNEKQEKKVIILKNVKVIPGKHCESSAINNMVNYLGYPVNEALIVGGGGAPSYIYLKDNFPFLGGRNLRMKEEFFANAGISYHDEKSDNPAESWKKIIELLNNGYPVVLKVNMQYLPYFYNGKYGPSYMSFGWHMITLFGIDLEKDIGYVTDTEKSDLQKIKLYDLNKARFAKADFFSPEGEFYWAEKKPTDYKIEWNKLQNNGISTYLQNMEAHSEDVKHVESGLSGLKNFQEYILETDKSIKPYLISPMFNLFYSCIETNGTGGAAFRNFFKTYLEECIEQTNDKRLKNGLALAEESIKEWRLLALKFLDASKKIKKIKSNEERKTLYENISLQAKKVYEAEEKMYNYFKEKNFKRIN